MGARWEHMDAHPWPLLSPPGLVWFPTPNSHPGRNWPGGKGRCFLHASWPTLSVFERNKFLAVLQTLPRPLLTARAQTHPACLPHALPGASEPPAHQGPHTGLPAENQKPVALSNPRPGAQARILVLFVSARGWNGFFGNSRKSFRKPWAKVS